MLDSWESLPAVAYRLGGADLENLKAYAAPNEWFIPLSSAIALLHLTLGTINVVRHGFNSFGSIEIGFGFAFLGLCFVGITMRKSLVTKHEGDFAVSFSDSGITIESKQGERFVRWRSVTSVQDAGHILLFRFASTGLFFVRNASSPIEAPCSGGSSRIA